MTTEKKKTGLELLREPFPSNQISKLCRSTKRDNTKGNCKVCGGYHGQPSIALDYVGHAALTDRLLDADPMWTWEPLAVSQNGYPVIDNDGGMWIKLTVCGVARLGYGDAQGKSGGDAMKERIGDALRNAAMRFGAALDLWHKGDLHVEDDDKTDLAHQPSKPPVQPPTTSGPDAEYHERAKVALKAIFGDDKQAALSKVEELTSFVPKGKTEADRIKGVRDYTKLAGQRLSILVHNLEKLIPKKDEPAICAQCGQPVDASGKCNAFPDCPNNINFQEDIPF
jgi:hypothetical protein